MRMTVNIRGVSIGLEYLVHLPPIADPEVPWRIILVERIVTENHDRSVFGQRGKRFTQPLKLIGSEPRPWSGHRSIQCRHVPHSFLRAHLARGPIIGSAAHGIDAYECDAFVLKGPRRVAE